MVLCEVWDVSYFNLDFVMIKIIWMFKWSGMFWSGLWSCLLLGYLVIDSVFNDVYLVKMDCG